MTTQIQALVNELEELGWGPRIWEAHGKVRVYCKVEMGKKFRKGGKVYFDYEDPTDAKEIYDGTLPSINGTKLKVWHDTFTVRTWAFKALGDKLQEHLSSKNINFQ